MSDEKISSLKAERLHRKGKQEIVAIDQCVKAISGLDKIAARRVVDYLISYLENLPS